MKVSMNEQGNEAGRKTTKKPNHISARRLIWFVVVCLIIFGAWLQKSIGSDSASVGSDSASDSEELYVESVASEVTFRNENLLDEHYKKHGIEMGFATADAYEQAAAAVVGNKEALHKTEAEDGDDVYYLVSTNELVIVSTDGYIRTYFKPDDGIEYYNRQ